MKLKFSAKILIVNPSLRYFVMILKFRFYEVEIDLLTY